MELEVGMYVRTKRRTLQPPQIARIINMSKDGGYKNQYYIELDKNLIPNYEYHIYEEDIEIARYSPIELVKVGDYVNGQVVTQIIPNNRKIEPSTMIYTGTNYFVGLYNENIKTIVTKEQFEAIQYKVV